MKKLLAAVTVLAVSTAQADTIYVDANCPGGDGSELDPYCSIQTAIDNAVDTDEIVVAPGTYFETIDFMGKAITLRSSDGAEVTVIDAQQAPGVSVVSCFNGEGPDTVLEGFTITGGTGMGIVGLLRGGGMFNFFSSSPTVIGCVFEGNVADSGGGMSNLDNCNPTVINCTFSDNSAFEGGGGGMSNFFNSSPTVANCTFDGNTAVNGGGMSNSDSNPTVTDCTFSENTAERGGGMYNHSGFPAVTNCTFSDNSAIEGGGGMSNSGWSKPTVINCTFSDNSAFEGGGMQNFFDAHPGVVNCRFTGNTASIGGGMCNCVSGHATVVNCTFSGNSATNGHALAFHDPNQCCPSDLIMANSLLWDGGNEIWNNDGSAVAISYTNVQGGWPGLGNIDADPLFVDADNGDYRLSPGSPCIDAADNTVFDHDVCGDCREPNPDDLPGCSESICEGIVCDSIPSCCDVAWDDSCADLATSFCNCAVLSDIDTDLDGNPRFVDDPDTADTGNGDPPIVDMGAYEFQGTPCPWDLDGDGNVFVVDLLLLLMDFGTCDGSPADFDGDGCVTVVDLLTLLFNFGPCPGGGCPWDVNGDGTVDKEDLWQVLGNFGPCDGCPEDVNGDGVVNGQDAAAVATHFGACP